MQLSLKNKTFQILIDHPLENYCGSRFDWTGKITQVHFKDISVLSSENLSNTNEHGFGRGLYNEFGIDSALGFEETETGEWFHKIGVGLLKKTKSSYHFSEKYEIIPAAFTVITEKNKIIIYCTSDSINGYSYRLKKEIELFEKSFSIKYILENTGEKKISTNEYNHNFIGIRKKSIGENTVLNFPFLLNSDQFVEIVNPENKVLIHPSGLKFKSSPNEPFFFSNLSGSKVVDALWEIHDYHSKIGIRETGTFETSSINVWGSKHVISPELFIEIDIPPGESKEWTRTYEVFEL